MPKPRDWIEKRMTRPAETVELLVCIKCRQGQDAPEDAERPGAALYRALSGDAVPGVTITPVECLSNCSRGCTIALRGPGRWTYVYGNLDPALHPELIREKAAKYAATADGLVPWRERPEHFRKNCIARLPPLVPPAPNLGEM
jgi:predicted metal-binding protein